MEPSTSNSEKKVNMEPVTSNSCELSAKKRKIVKEICENNQNDQNQNVAAVEDAAADDAAVEGAVADDAESLSGILKLPVDCFEEVFDYLSLKDLLMISQTCKRLQRIAGHCIKQTYPELDLATSTNYYSPTEVYLHWDLKRIEITHLLPYIKKLRIRDQMISLRHMQSLRQIDIGYSWDAYVNYRFDHMSQNLGNIEHVKLKCCAHYNVYEAILKFCPKLKKLQMIYNLNEAIEHGINNNWMCQKYPELTHFEYDHRHRNADAASESQLNALKVFFKQNPKIMVFSIWYQNLNGLMENGALNELKLQVLAVEYEHSSMKKTEKMVSQLNKLHEDGVYQHLYIGLRYAKEYQMNGWDSCIIPFKGLLALKNLYLYTCDTNITLNFSNLELLHVFAINISKFEDEAWLSNLTRLKRIELQQATSSDISTVARIASLKEIVVHFFVRNEGGKCDDALDLLALNTQRSTLPFARKITIFLEERVYLRTKWTMYVEYNMIEIKRLQSHSENAKFKMW